MGVEIERKFLVRDDSWRPLATGTVYRQGYLASDKGCTVRVRVAGEQGYLTIKGMTQGFQRAEYEYAIPLADATELLDTLCQRPLIEKTRYRLPLHGVIWEIDEFAGENQGLIMAEVELKTADQVLVLPDWIGEEVSSDPRYYNSNLAKVPFSQWGNRS